MTRLCSIMNRYGFRVARNPNALVDSVLVLENIFAQLTKPEKKKTSKSQKKYKKEESFWCEDPIHCVHAQSVVVKRAHSATSRPPQHQPVTPPCIQHATLANVKAPINERRNRSDFGSEFLFHAPESVAIVDCNQVHSETQMSKSSRATNSMEVGFAVLGKIKVNDDIHRLNVNTSSKEI
jgi:hypothetical protein